MKDIPIKLKAIPVIKIPSKKSWKKITDKRKQLHRRFSDFIGLGNQNPLKLSEKGSNPVFHRLFHLYTEKSRD